MKIFINILLFISILCQSLHAQAGKQQQLLIAEAAAGSAPIALISHVQGISTDTNGFTTSSINTSGANFTVCANSFYPVGGTPTVTDSKSNTYTTLTVYNTGGTHSVQIVYSTSATTGSGHTFTVTGNSDYETLSCAAFSNVTAIDAGSDTGSSNAAASTIQPGSVTPSVSGCLFITAYGGQVSIDSISSPFTITDSGGNPGFAVEGALAYEIQTSATARNPTWTSLSTGVMSAAAAVFKP